MGCRSILHQDGYAVVYQETVTCMQTRYTPSACSSLSSFSLIFIPCFPLKLGVLGEFERHGRGVGLVMVR